MKIEELIQRLEIATVASRYIDCHLWVVSKGGDARMRVCDSGTKDFVWERGVDGFWVRDVVNFKSVPRYTDSIDAAIALCKRVLPDANCYGVGKDKTGWSAFVSRNSVESGHWLVEAEAHTAPIALCLAIMKAKLTLESAAMSKEN